MFSPAIYTMRQRIFNEVIYGQSQSNDSPVEVNEFEISDPDQLSGVDQAAFYDLDEYGDQLNIYISTPFDMSSLCFKEVGEQIVSGLDTLDAILGALPSARFATRKFNYCASGLKNLLVHIQTTQCIHPSLVAQRDSHIASGQRELKDLFIKAKEQHSKQFSQIEEAQGLRIVHPAIKRTQLHASPLAIAVIVLVAIIHGLMGVACESCNFILLSLRGILLLASEMQDNCSTLFIQQHIRDIPITLPVALEYLNLPPKLQLYVACPTCSYLYREGTGVDIPETCTASDIDGSVCDARLFSTHYKGGKTRKRPVRRYSHQLFADWLGELLLCPGVEELLESAKPSLNPIMTDVWNAPFLSSFCGGGKSNFFDAEPQELCLCMLLFHDFFNPLGNKTAGKRHSVGVFFMICLNLPADIRYDASHAYIPGVIPGPSETKMDCLQHFVRPIVEDMMEIFSPGIWVSKTHKYPNGRKVRVAVPLNSMYTLAARSFGGFTGHKHNCFCFLCLATRNRINQNNLEGFEPHTMSAHRIRVAEWQSADTSSKRSQHYTKHGVRSVEWLRFSWWDPFVGTIVGPMHWTKNILEKQLCQNMEWSWTRPSGIPLTRGLVRPVSALEYEWGQRAIDCLTAQELVDAKLTAPLVRYLCYRIEACIIDSSGNLVTQNDHTEGVPVTVARAHYHLSVVSTPKQLESHATSSDLRYLCNLMELLASGSKRDLAEQLLEHYIDIRVQDIPDSVPQSITKNSVAVLGVGVLTQVRDNMGRTTLPRWLKHPPKDFATLSHGKLQAEEYKSLALVSFVITLVRLWGTLTAGPLRDRLDNFLHLMLAVRILAFQSLVESDIQAFEHHYGAYLDQLETLYPSETRTSTQHLGLHIPALLRALGPSTRYSESTCEMFNGLLQDITTNHKFGDLELTMHREFIMASRLKGLIQQKSFSTNLGPFGETICDFLSKKIPGHAGKGWNALHSPEKSVAPDEATLMELNKWASLRKTRDFTYRFFCCSRIQQGNVVYAPYSKSSGDSCILFYAQDSKQLHPGRIDSILEEPRELVLSGNTPRIILLVKPFFALSNHDSTFDPYWNHPIIGRDGAAIARLYYDRVVDESLLLEPQDIVSHIAVCDYHDLNKTISKECVVVLSLDLKHRRYV